MTMMTFLLMQASANDMHGLNTSNLNQMPKRAEWIACIAKNDIYTWCNRHIGLDWIFINHEHAENTIAAEGRMVPCKKCLKAKPKD